MRIILVFPVGWCIIQERYVLALILFFVAGISDLLDGFLARHFNWVSRLGGFLDPAADKVLMTVAYYAMAEQGMIPYWLFYVVVGRDLLIVTGALAYKLVTHALEMEPLMISKINTGMQITFILFMLVQAVFDPFPGWTVTAFIYLILCCTLLSGVF
ncbi:MAG: CDP-alcohol phosphatidyltransferase family protein, partial [bacterium]